MVRLFAIAVPIPTSGGELLRRARGSTVSPAPSAASIVTRTARVVDEASVSEVPSTMTLTTIAMMPVCNDIRQWAAERLELVIADLDPNYHQEVR